MEATVAQDLRDLQRSNRISAWQVFSGASPYDASIVVAGAKEDVDAIHNQSSGSAPKCLQTYSAELKQMGLTNAEAASPPS